MLKNFFIYTILLIKNNIIITKLYAISYIDIIFHIFLLSKSDFLLIM